MPLLDKATALEEVRQRFTAILEANLEETDEDDDEEHVELDGFIDDVVLELVGVVDEVFSRANPH